ncbi:Exodeoxyribonuclease VII large subunit [Sulfurimonas denitrificans DSM 1251]|uniref:Exodeoxyribonuclease 7 large subunit n=1 Tax=Sulfurimonas denitrificans (strain ATCC 33889 / DSM 1251) TaxID=326298 RepID=EX7L_SULDN|nr:exodeoxyribonuclease VII large subunit [Sulfurimonas denitrificans]Q30SS1.1 RecName: Full=Exodeoxyribonuclease 7 large subunit; AltName: Full=Exodeoxyribonuclease VII large subunit; Short=Exonuclease VII large subunit [Sulfurimonas denitrificans DSM 1251]ABB43960.1 Exodeoxyribonuclease VII large subunit [Sulfurimonas denitrificans DSM 1251]
MYTLSVSSLNEQIKALLEESFSRVLVEGELSRITFHSSGHIYFTLKDENSTIKAVIFKANAAKLKFQLQEGLKVILDGAITLYKPRGEYQINCFSISPAGHGALALAYEQLKNRLASKGYFESSRKKQLPKFPKRIALITSATGAAVADMLRVAMSRYRAIEIDIYDVLVQGDNAAPSIIRALSLADTKGYDIIVLGRGGGSIEDLWAFNEEIVADAIFSAITPIISAVGHEIDWVISDFVADLRAPTPSAAMEMCLPDEKELYQFIDSLVARYEQMISQKLYGVKQELEHISRLYQDHSIEKKISYKLEEIAQLKLSFTNSIYFKMQSFNKEVESIKIRFPNAIQSRINIVQNQVLTLQKMLESNHPRLKTKKGFAQISKDSKVIDIESLIVDEVFDLMSDRVVISAKVINKKNI